MNGKLEHIASATGTIEDRDRGNFPAHCIVCTNALLPGDHALRVVANEDPRTKIADFIIGLCADCYNVAHKVIILRTLRNAITTGEDYANGSIPGRC
mgnify:CR=1 FL=1